MTPASASDESSNTGSTRGELSVSQCQHELEQLSAKIQQDRDVMLALPREDTAPRGKSMSLLEIYCGENSSLTEMALKMGLRARRFTKQDGDLLPSRAKQRFGRSSMPNVPEMSGCHRSASYGATSAG